MVDFAQEQDAFLGSAAAPMRTTSGASSSKAATWGKLAVGAALGVVGVSYCISVQTSLQAQQATIALMQQQLCVFSMIMPTLTLLVMAC